MGDGFGGGMIRPQMNSNQFGNHMGMPQQQQRNSRFDMPSDIEFMRPPQIKVKGARKLPTHRRMDRPVHNQNVNRARVRNGSRKKFHNVTASLAMGPVQSGYNSPVSSTTSSSQQHQHVQPGKNKAKLSKSQRARMRKRLAKERKKEA